MEVIISIEHGTTRNPLPTTVEKLASAFNIDSGTLGVQMTRWIAGHPTATRHRTEPAKPRHELSCGICGSEFLSHHPQTEWCPECRKRWFT